MARQQIAQDWKIVETLFDQTNQKFIESRKNAGHFTQSTIAGKVGRVAVERGYEFKSKLHHGFGGYRVNGNGDTIEVLPGRI